MPRAAGGIGLTKAMMAPFAGMGMLVGDMAKDASVAQMVSDIMVDTGRMNQPVNIGGRARIGAAERSLIDLAKALFDINLFGMIRGTSAVHAVMRTQKAGRIINIRSVSGASGPVQHTLHRHKTCG